MQEPKQLSLRQSCFILPLGVFMVLRSWSAGLPAGGLCRACAGRRPPPPVCLVVPLPSLPGPLSLAPSAPGCEASPRAADLEPTVSTSAHSFTFLHYGSGYLVLSVAMAFPIQEIF